MYKAAKVGKRWSKSMFCKNCGTQLPDNVKFCGKCGATVSQPAVFPEDCSPMPKRQEKRQLSLSSMNMRVAVIGTAAVLLLVIVIGICIGRNGGASRAERDYAVEGSAVAAEEHNHDITVLNVSSAVVLEGQYERLESVTMSPGADGSVGAITYTEKASFPVLESLECGAVLKVSDSGGKGYFDEKDFPQLKSVTMKVVNKYIDEDIMMTYLIFQEMYDAGHLQSFRMENSYTIEDLYGTWSNDGQTFTLTFEKSGTLRIADASNLIGVDVLKYQEVDGSTLSLSADQSGLLGMISLSMKYKLFGDRLWVEIAGQEFALTRK